MNLYPPPMRVLFVVHVGETLGHLARAITVARELEKCGCIAECAGHERAGPLWRAAALNGAFHPVSWDWSHNESDPATLSARLGARLLDSVSQMREVFERCEPDYVVGFPGFASVQLARHYRIPHAAVVHGSYLAPLIHLADATPEETAVLSLTTRVCVGPLNDAFRLVARRLSLPILSYEEFMETERIFVAQPGLPFRRRRNTTIVGFIKASLGEPLREPPAHDADAVFVTFGTGNLCDFSRLLELARDMFTRVIANTGSLSLTVGPDRVTTRPFISSSDIASRVRAVVSHGGIGTVGTFAEHGLPQLIVPTEPDQANTAIHTRRAGLAETLGLESFLERTTLGRRLPVFSDSDFLEALTRLKGARVARVPADGAAAIAADLCGMERCMRA